MAEIAYLERARDDPPDPQCDPELLASLKEQVETARESCSAPMALVTVTLVGKALRYQSEMSPDQAAAIEDSGLGRQELMLSDTGNDPRSPATLSGMGIASLLSSPILIDERYVGALHIADTQSRQFTDAHAEAASEIAHLIGKRLERFLGPEREERRESLMRRAVAPAFAELRNALVPLNLGTSDLRVVAADLLPLVKRATGSSLEGDQLAVQAYEDLASLIEEISRASARVREVVMVVEGLWGEGGRHQVLADLLQTAAGLALHSTRLVGGVEMPIVAPEYSVVARRSVAVAGLSLMFSRAAEANASAVTHVSPLFVQLDTEADWVCVRVRGDHVDAEQYAAIATEVEMLLFGDRDLVVRAGDTDISMRLTRC